MRKFILTLFVLAALSILAVLVAGLEGRLRVTLMGFDVATDLSVAVGALLAAALVLVIVVLTAQYLWHLPARLHARRTMVRQRLGTQALAEALMALARGDAEGARAGVDLARRKLPHEPLPLLVAASNAPSATRHGHSRTESGGGAGCAGGSCGSSAEGGRSSASSYTRAPALRRTRQQTRGVQG